MNDGITFELSQEFEQEVFDFMIEMLKGYDDKTETATYVIGQIKAALDKIEEQTYKPTVTTIDDYLADLGQD